jgi:hypothetical protein
MAASGTLDIAQVLGVSSDGAVCVVRCVEGAVYPGDTVDLLAEERGGPTGPPVRVQEILRYERPVPFIDPPHTAKILLTGPDCEILTRSFRVYTHRPPGEDPQ